MKKLTIYMLILLLTGCASVTKPTRNSDGFDNLPETEEPVESAEPAVPDEPEDKSLFHEYKDEASEILSSMTLEEKIGQMFLVRCPEKETLNLYLSMKPGGFIMFGKDFADKTMEQVIDDITYYQDSSSIPMIIGVDEEGGTVVRVSSNPLLAEERFRSPQELYEIGGLEEITRAAKEKSELLLSLGINLNLAPVADVSVNETDFIYQRSFGKNALETANYVRTVVRAMKESKMSSALKHFPGYGNNADTHTGSSYDMRPYEQFLNNDFIPFEAGIESGAESILVSHNVIDAIDSSLPASLSKSVIDILRNQLKFTGIIMTDDLSMGAITELQSEFSPEVMAVLAGNDMLVVTDFESSFKTLLGAAKAEEISVERIDESVVRILQWKLYMNLM